MALHLHHVFILTEPGCEAVDELVELGLVEGTRSAHPGQGTANRRFFFANLYLEFIYFANEREAAQGPGRVIRLLDRYRADDGSPFGLVFSAESKTDVAAFPGFDYQPVYFDDGVTFRVGDNVGELAEPSCILLPYPVPQALPEARSARPFERVLRVRVSVPTVRPSVNLQLAASTELVELVPGVPPLMEIDFGSAGSACDLRPAVPLILRW